MRNAEIIDHSVLSCGEIKENGKTEERRNWVEDKTEIRKRFRSEETEMRM
jgi:hypothetical protein